MTDRTLTPAQVAMLRRKEKRAQAAYWQEHHRHLRRSKVLLDEWLIVHRALTLAGRAAIAEQEKECG